MSFPDHSPDYVYVIAEAGVNHNGDPELAKKLIDAAKETGADAVKFQIFDPDEVVTAEAPLAEYQKKQYGGTQRDMIRTFALNQDDFRMLADYAQQKDIDYIVTPFDAESAKFLATLPVAAIKIPSGEITNTPFLKKVAALDVPTILSTGMSNLEEVNEAVAIFKGVPLILLHCTSAYPTQPEDVNLRAMETLRKTFNVPVGLSDHTENTAVPVAAAALGAAIIEKHLTLDRTMVGPDHAASLEPDTFTEMVRGIREASAALGSPEKRRQTSEENTAAVARRSVVLVQNVTAGQTIDETVVAIKRPGTGISPKELERVIGKTVKTDLPSGTVLTWDLLS